MRVAFIFAALAALWGHPANATIIITGEGGGTFTDYADACSDNLFDPVCMNPQVTTGVYSLYFSFPDQPLLPGTVFTTYRLDSCPVLGASRCQIDAAVGSGFSYFESYHGAGAPLDTLEVFGSSLTVAHVDDPDGRLLDIFRVQAVPEPGTWAMFLLGFLGIGWASRRKSSTRPGGCLRRLDRRQSCIRR